MKMTVDSERCKGCQLCMSVCPKNIVSMQEEKLNSEGFYTAECIDQAKCISCAFCAMMCPECAITVSAEKFEKNSEKEGA